MSRPPGAATRHSSCTAISGWGSRWSTLAAITASKLPSGSDRAVISRRANWRLDSPRLAAFFRARASMASDWSVHSTEPARFDAARENSPVPAAQSSTRAPAGTSSPTRVLAAAFTCRLLHSNRSYSPATRSQKVRLTARSHSRAPPCGRPSPHPS